MRSITLLLSSLLLSSLLLGSSGLLAAAASPQSTPPGKPNVLLITADDLGCNLSCYGEKRIQTPRLDALSAEGVRFQNAYVAQSSCSPSRAALLTGQWPHVNRQVGLSHLGFRMPSGLPNLPALLRSAGYYTGIIGKLHVEPAEEIPFDWMPKEKAAGLPTRKVRWVAEQSAAFFAKAREAGQPFFYYANFFDPHGPFNKETDQVDGIPERPLKGADIQDALPLNLPDEKQARMVTARLFNTILRLDVGVGLLLDQLQAAGLASHTLVIFVGDNGLGIPRGKTTCYELGVRVPLIVRWPGIAKAQVRDELVSLVDVVPTVLAAAGAKDQADLPGLPLQPLLHGLEVKWREMLFTEMNFHEPQIFNPQRSVRDARFKLLLHLLPKGEQAPVEFFDLAADPQEQINLAADPAHAGTRARLEAELKKWREQTGDPLLEDARIKSWSEASQRWAKFPRVQAGPHQVVKLPAGETDVLFAPLAAGG